MRFFLVLVTTPDAKTSGKLSRGLVESNLAACVNRVPGITSRYRWKGKVRTSREELLLIKTTGARLGELTRWVRKNHPYEVCEVAALPIASGNKPYLDWIMDCVS